jgi:hypothetical protein
MKKLAGSLFVMAASVCFAQQWEFGGVGGAGFLSNVNIDSPAGSAKAGFGTGGAFGAFFGQSIGAHFAGEVRYEYLQSNLQLSSGGATAHFAGRAHAVHYDLLWHTSRKNSPVQFFAAVGGGMKIFQGTGTEEAYQPLSQFGYFTKTQAVKPMASVGGGIIYRVSPRIFLRTEFRDFITPFPTQLITPAPNAKFGSILNDFVPMLGIDYVF